MDTGHPKISLYSPHIILGAGLSGLSAALTLLDQGVSGKDLLILEAQNRVGGRINSIQLKDGTIVERGAAWYHLDDNGNNPFMQFIIERYGQDLAHIIPQNIMGACLGITAAGLGPIEAFDDEMDLKLRAVFNSFQRENPGSDLSLLDVCQKMDEENKDRAMIHIRRLAENYMGSANEADSSAQEVFADPYGDGGPQVWEGLERGVQAMAQELRSRGVSIQLAECITDIQETPQGCVLVSQSGNMFSGANLICTLPTPVLSSITSDPVISEYIKGIQISHFTKIFVPMDKALLEERFEQDSAIVNTASDRFAEISILPAGKPVVTLFATGETALEWEKMDHRALVQTAHSILKGLPMMGGYEDAMHTNEIAATDWNTNPLFQGSYGAMRIGHKRQGPLRSEAGRIVFAGTELHPVAGGSMVGAFESGKMAAQMTLGQAGASAALNPLTPAPQLP